MIAGWPTRRRCTRTGPRRRHRGSLCFVLTQHLGRFQSDRDDQECSEMPRVRASRSSSRSSARDTASTTFLQNSTEFQLGRQNVGRQNVWTCSTLSSTLANLASADSPNSSTSSSATAPRLFSHEKKREKHTKKEKKNITKRKMRNGRPRVRFADLPVAHHRADGHQSRARHAALRPARLRQDSHRAPNRYFIEPRSTKIDIPPSVVFFLLKSLFFVFWGGSFPGSRIRAREEAIAFPNTHTI